MAVLTAGSAPERLTIALSGDSIITRGALCTALPGSAELRQLLTGADVAFTNLESIPADFQGDPSADSGGAHFGARSRLIEELTEFGFNLLSAANNHSLNYGVGGVRALIGELESRGIPYAGIGENLARARRPAYADTARGSVGLVACSSTFGKGHEAADQLADLPGRPGLNPLRFDTEYRVLPQQLETLRDIAQSLGFEDRMAREIMLGFKYPPAEAGQFSFLNSTFRAAQTPSTTTRCKSNDLVNITDWVGEARRRSDVVIVSIHSHEQGVDLLDPAEFHVEFAHACIDAGADIVVGHGPHFLRPLEFYRGRPIFYSLGNFIGQNELVERLPADSYTDFRIAPDQTPSIVFETRTQQDSKGFPSEQRYWETIVPILTYDRSGLVDLEIHPVTLDLGGPPQRRGKPRLATGADSARILQTFAQMSTQWGADTSLKGNALKIRIPASSIQGVRA